MKKFLILIREDLSAVNKMTPEQMEADIAEYVKWKDGLQKENRHVMSDPLEGSGAMIYKNKVETDGPFIESKEAITGFFVFLAKDTEEAISIAKTCPIFKYEGLVELRPIMEF
ncbi:YciI family protein [Imperialibacter roseus]|uniref:YciI family protein n=1 Tax=Imperialibacter roseus TaxID=1324217 RepID=A0ABZ0IJ95_9BACT|nr:YciI family protein [Imperialibacter roseus]WOK04587.1 YciI family protein [Imperialibacter roseus]